MNTEELASAIVDQFNLVRQKKEIELLQAENAELKKENERIGKDCDWLKRRNEDLTAETKGH